MRRARIKAEGDGYYHCISRVIEKRHILGDTEKEKLRQQMRTLADFCGIKILTYAIVSSHLHILLKVPLRQEISDEELLRRLGLLYEPFEVNQIAQELKDLRDQGFAADAERFKQRYTYRMYDLGLYFKSLKWAFSTWYNRRNGRCGPLWNERFKSILVERSEHALTTMAAYIDLNPVRAGLVSDPKDYRFCGYGEAMGGGKEARDGLDELVQAFGVYAPWRKVRAIYRRLLFARGERTPPDPQRGRPGRPGFGPEQVREVLRTGGQLPMPVLLRCRVRYFSDGLALGSRAFLEEVFQRYRAQFGATRKDGARPMRHGDWAGLCTLRDLRLDAISLS